MNMNYMNTFLKHLLVICLLVVLGGGNALAHRNVYPFETTVTVDPTGKGSVYASYDGNAQTATYSTKTYSGSVEDWDIGTTASVKLSAEAEPGYRFLRWEDSSGNVVSRVRETSVSQVYNLTNAKYKTNWWLIFPYRNYTTTSSFSYTAYFDLQGNVIARVAAGQESIGSADIQEEVLTPGEKITLKASNINGSEFKGWSFDHWELNGQVISTSKELKVEVPSTSVTDTYVAYFRQADTEYYCFIRNKATGRYLKLSDQNEYIKPTNKNNPVGSFNGSFTLVEETQAISDPGCVFSVAGTSNNNVINKASLVAQGISVGFMPGSKIIHDEDFGLTISPASAGCYYISANYQVKESGQTANIPIYFRDNNRTPDLAGARSSASEWELLELSTSTLSQQFFGLAPNKALKKGDKYYTTLYTTFPYQLQSGTAYYVNHESIVPYGDESEGKFRVVCQKVANGKVPAKEAVIIECDGLNPEDNKIVPLPQNESITEFEGNYLKSHITFRDDEKKGDGKIYVLSVGQKGLAFYKLQVGIPLSDNKAYSELTEEQQSLAKNATFFIGETTTGIQEEVILTEDMAGNEIYDLQGRRVQSPVHGIYIVNGKKLVIK